MSAVLPLPARPPAAGLRRFALLLVGVVLVIDAIWLMGKGLFNLGVLLPFAIGLGFVVIGWRWQPLMARLLRSVAWRRAWQWGWAIFVLWLLSVAVFWMTLLQTGQDATAMDDAPQAIVVLGSGTPGGKPSPVLQARLDTALAQASRYPDAKVLVSGGTDFAESRAEAQIMGDYLREQGLPAARIVQEEKSTSTHENLVFSAAVLHTLGIEPDEPVRVITSDFHTLRALWIAKRAGYTDVDTAGAPTPLYLRYNAWLREYFAFISGWLLGEY